MNTARGTVSGSNNIHSANQHFGAYLSLALA